MEIVTFLAMWLVGFIILVVGDTIWLGYVLKDLIKKDFEPYLSIKNGKAQIRLGIGVLAWSIISLGTVFFISQSSSSLSETFGLGLFFGFVLYACYDLTNYTFFSQYSKRFVLIDIAWGSFICSLVALGGYFTREALSSGGLL